ncbi:MAG: murein L,D-transpeptidase catalytic domain family protein [Alcanivoracaceae bacterium]|nr:murein L,D-transpeptidase catalytic domain family protein [Alcanivoracaceae bacterium]
MKLILFITLLFNLLMINTAQADIKASDLIKLAPDISENVLNLAVNALNCASQDSKKSIKNISIIDYSLPSTAKRFWTFDIINNKLLYKELVAHGKNTGANYAKHFSNTPDSKQSSLGLFKTGATYTGRNGYSLYLNGLEKDFNDLALKRSIVMHGAKYVSQDFINKHGRLGRSWGCPTFTQTLAKEIIDQIKHGQYLFIYYPDNNWLKKSTYLNCPS